MRGRNDPYIPLDIQRSVLTSVRVSKEVVRQSWYGHFVFDPFGVGILTLYTGVRYLRHKRNGKLGRIDDPRQLLS